MKKEIKIAHIFVAFLAVMSIIALILIIGTSRVEKTIIGMQESTDKYIVEENAINVMREVSDYLTEKCQSFVSTGDTKDAKAYFKEVDTDKHREASLKAVEQYGKDDDIYISLSDALSYSNRLANTECYAMRLAAAGYGMDPAVLPERIARVALTDEDSALPADQQRAAQAASYMVVCPQADHFETVEAIDKAVANLNGGVYGSAFGLPDDTHTAAYGGWYLYGNEAALRAFLDAERPDGAGAKWPGRGCRFLVYQPDKTLAWGKKGIYLLWHSNQ